MREYQMTIGQPESGQENNFKWPQHENILRSSITINEKRISCAAIVVPLSPTHAPRPSPFKPPHHSYIRTQKSRVSSSLLTTTTTTMQNLTSSNMQQQRLKTIISTANHYTTVYQQTYVTLYSLWSQRTTHDQHHHHHHQQQTSSPVSSSAKTRNSEDYAFYTACRHQLHWGQTPVSQEIQRPRWPLLMNAVLFVRAVS